MSSVRPVKIFYSYSHEDEAMRDELEKQLTILKRENVITTWHDRQIEAGSEWHEEISTHLESADIILLLISPDFVASDYAYNIEARRAMQLHEAKRARVIPVILKEVDNWRSVFGALQALPKNAVPVESWNRPNEAFADIASSIRAIVERLTSNTNGADTQEEDEEVAIHNERDIPDVLPYLCDRSEQEYKLINALQRHELTMPARPFVCVIHGEEFECHQGFVRRMIYTSVPQALNLKAKNLSVEQHTFEWPLHDVAHDEWSGIFAANLGLALLNNRNSPSEDVKKYIATYERPLLLASHVLTESFLEAGMDLFEQLLKFWSSWPELPPGRTVINCVCVKHQRLGKFGFWQRRKLKGIDADLRAFIDQLEVSSYHGLGGVVLPELKGIRRSDVEAWSRIDEISNRWQIPDRDIRGLFEGALVSPEGLISMEPLAEQLINLIVRCHRQRN